MTNIHTSCETSFCGHILGSFDRPVENSVFASDQRTFFLTVGSVSHGGIISKDLLAIPSHTQDSEGVMISNDDDYRHHYLLPPPPPPHVLDHEGREVKDNASFDHKPRAPNVSERI